MKVDKKTKQIMAIISAVIICVIASIFGIQNIQKQKSAKEAAEEAARLSQEYKTNLELIKKQIITGAADAENCGNLINKVWHNAIYEDYDVETNKYTMSKSVFVSDFNKALYNLFADSSFQIKINKIKDNQSSVQNLMKKNDKPTCRI